MILRPYCSVVLALIGFSVSASGWVTSRPHPTRAVGVHFAAPASDVAVPYDAAARLAYEAAGSRGDYEEFRQAFEAQAIVDVIAKRQRPNVDRPSIGENLVSDKTAIGTTMAAVQEEELDVADGAESSTKVAHLQKKLEYWKREQRKLQDNYQNYLALKANEGNTNPVYRREGTIDHYTPRPIYDEVTERIQIEIWSIGEQIKLTRAKIAEERLVEQVRQEAAHRLANHDAEIAGLQAQFQEKLEMVQKEKEQEIALLRTQFQDQLEDAQKEKEELQVQAEERSKQLTEKESEIDLLAQNLEKAKILHERTRREAKESLQALTNEYTALVEKTRQESTKRLSEKEQEINTLSKDIHSLVAQLSDKRRELKVQDDVLAMLENVLKEKEAVLRTLCQERASLRSLVSQSFKVLKARVKKRLAGQEDVDAAELSVKSSEEEEEGGSQVTVNGAKSNALVGSQTGTFE